LPQPFSAFLGSSQTARTRSVKTRGAYYWATHGGAELDLLIFATGKRFGFEFRFADAPSLTRSMRVAMEVLRLDRLRVLYPGSKTHPLHENATVIPLDVVKDPRKMLTF
jgi:hypothetical protein